MPPQRSGLLSHAAVRTAPEHEMPSNGSAETRFGHDFSQVTVRPSAPIVCQDYSNASRPLFPQRCPFEGVCHTYQPRVQAKQEVGQPGDKYEQKADRAAEQVHTEASKSSQGGSPLPPAIEAGLERQFQQPLGDLRIHAGEEGKRVAKKLSALAVSEGANIYFAPGAHAPGTCKGDRILRHETAHYLQRRPGSEQDSTRWSAGDLEAEANLAADTIHRFTIKGNAHGAQALTMKTYISTVGGNPYLDQAVKFYKLWENETAVRINSYQQIVNRLASESNPLPKFRIVSHSNGYNLFLPLLQGAKNYAQLPALGLQTQKALTVEFGRLGHLTSDMTGTVHGWLTVPAKGKPLSAKEKKGLNAKERKALIAKRRKALTAKRKTLLGRLGLTNGLAGIWKELVWWGVDEHFARNVKEDEPDPGGPKKTTNAQRNALKKEVKSARDAVKTAALAALPSTAKNSNVDDLITEVQAVFTAQKWSWGNMPAGYLKQKLNRLKLKDVTALEKEVKAGSFEKKLAVVKGWVNSSTHIEIRGCNIGSNDTYLNGIREFFGTKPTKLPSISAPKLYQFFGTPGGLVLPQGRKRPPVARSLKFLFEETFNDASLAKDVNRAVNAAKLTSISDLANVLQYADIKGEFEKWWKMKQKAKGVATASLKSATLKDFRDFLTTAPPRTFPVNAPGVSNESMWYMILLPSTAIDAMLAWVKDQGYILPGGADPRKTFFGSSRKWNFRKFRKDAKKIMVDWLGDNYPVPDKIYFPEDPEYKKNIRKLP